MPDTSIDVATVSGLSVLLFTTAETTVWSPTTKKRGACSLTMSDFFVRVVTVPTPNWLCVEFARAVARHEVSESG